MKIILTLFLTTLLIKGCSSNEDETLLNENKQLKHNIDSLKHETDSLKKEYSELKNSQHSEAKDTAEKNPFSKLKEKIASNKTSSSARDQWVNFRNSEKKYAGTIVTWKCVFLFKETRSLMGLQSGTVSLCELEDRMDRTVIIDGGPGFTDTYVYDKTSWNAWLPIVDSGTSVANRDMLLIKGKFECIDGNGNVVLIPLSIKKIGYTGY